MDRIYTAPAENAPEIVIPLDLRYDLQSAGLLLDTYGNFEDLTDEEVERREAENTRRVELFEAAYLKTLAQVAQERGVTVYAGDVTSETDTPYGDRGDTLERSIWQEAHDRTAAEPLWAESAVSA